LSREQKKRGDTVAPAIESHGAEIGTIYLSRDTLAAEKRTKQQYTLNVAG
jgi:hypothetical protein